MATFRLAMLAIVGVSLLPSVSLAQIGLFGHRLRTPPNPYQIADHLNGYYAGNHKHGGYGYGGGAGYGYGGGSGSTYGGGFFFPGYGNTYGLYPYGSGYNYSSPNYAPPAVLSRPTTGPNAEFVDPATGLPFLPTAPRALALPAPASIPSVE